MAVVQHMSNIVPPHSLTIVIPLNHTNTNTLKWLVKPHGVSPTYV